MPEDFTIDPLTARPIVDTVPEFKPEPEPVIAAPTRDSIRAAIFSSKSKKSRSKEVVFFGQTIEIRQPRLDDILGAGAEDVSEGMTTESIKKQSVRMMVQYAYVPGTDARVFEDTDYDAIMSLPFGEDFTRLQTTIGELTNINFPVVTNS